ncbi:hypothetical protein DFH09DRAFT_1137543 [Mycena vulgaris]|nr:hypothetical protein DFH09DRAFT_1137543 [Mycena vulgaris]
MSRILAYLRGLAGASAAVKFFFSQLRAQPTRPRVSSYPTCRPFFLKTRAVIKVRRRTLHGRIMRYGDTDRPCTGPTRTGGSGTRTRCTSHIVDPTLQYEQ